MPVAGEARNFHDADEKLRVGEQACSCLKTINKRERTSATCGRERFALEHVSRARCLQVLHPRFSQRFRRGWEGTPERHE